MSNIHALRIVFTSLALCSATARAETVEPLPSSTADPSGVLVPETPPPASAAGPLLAVPRAGATVVAMPVRGGLTLFSRYEVRERVLDFFFNDERTFGVYPMAGFETGLPTTVGLRLVHKNVFWTGARLKLRADYGGDSRHRLEGGLDTPSFAGGRLRAKLTGGWLRQPNAPFYGIGDQQLAQPDAAAVDLPGRAPVAVSSSFGQDVIHGELAAEIRPAGPVFAAVSGAYFARNFSDAPDSFDPNTLVGWGEGTRVAYGELQLGWDSLATGHQFVPVAAPSTGTKVVAFAGLARDARGTGAVAYTRYGGSALRYFDLYNGDRVLILRARVEGVTGDEARIPFTDLPRLGGPVWLRGYARDRFRDRVSMLASVEYRYPVWRQLSAYVFVDAGRVAPGLAEARRMLLEPRDVRVGGGGGLELMARERFQLRLQAAGSSEGLFFQLAMEPIYRLPTHNYAI